MSDEEVMRMTNANSAIPARRSTLARSALYGAHGPLAVFVQQLNAGYGVPRPKTPAYEIIRDSFRNSVRAIAGGAEVQTELHTAAQKIDQEMTTHRDYPDPWAQP
jgi:multiple sugar transport system substrate-binding protein